MHVVLLVFLLAASAMLASAKEIKSSLDPKNGIFFRVFKQANGPDPFYRSPGSHLERDGVMSNWDQGALEAWVWSPAQGRYELYKKFTVSAYRGLIGPKRKRGDHQTPEGFYGVQRLNPRSRYGKGLWLNYPNQHDRQQSPAWTGSDLEIHGDHRSDGCLAMDRQIHEIYRLAEAALQGGQSEIPVHIFPFPLTEENLKKVKNNQWINFWKTLKPGYDAFESSRIPPKMGVDPVNQQYLIQSARGSEKSQSVPQIQSSVPIEESELENAPMARSIEASENFDASPKASIVCGDAIKAYFGQEANREKVQKYLKIQGELTLHRLAWSYLKLQDGKTVRVEEVIKRLLAERDPSLHKKFLEKAPNHTALILENIDLLRESVIKRFGDTEINRPYLMKYSDKKMLGLLLETEKSLGHGKKKDLIDFVNMIHSSYGRTDGTRENHLKVAERTVNRLTRELEKMGNDIEKFITSQGCSRSELSATCDPNETQGPLSTKFVELFQESQSIQDSLSSTLIERQADLLEANRWGNYWLHVSGKRKRRP